MKTFLVSTFSADLRGVCASGPRESTDVSFGISESAFLFADVHVLGSFFLVTRATSGIRLLRVSRRGIKGPEVYLLSTRDEKIDSPRMEAA